MIDITLGVSEAIELINQTLDEAYPFVLIEGEVASFKVNQAKFVFFDIKDESGTLGCFMMVFKLKFPIEDGMRVKILAQPKLTNWGRFSLTVQEIQPIGEGDLKKSQELLKQKLLAEGLFDESRKRLLPQYPVRIVVVSSSQAAGYKDFIKIFDNRWGGLEVTLADVTVQGMDAPAQIVGALKELNERAEPLDVIAIIRGGGSADDLAAFSHEDVVRAIALSRTPTIVGVGHEVDISLADLAADVRAATPSNAAELLVPDKQAVLAKQADVLARIYSEISGHLGNLKEELLLLSEDVGLATANLIQQRVTEVQSAQRTIKQLDPSTVLRRGYALARYNDTVITSVADVTIGSKLTVQITDGLINTEVLSVNK